MIRYTDFMEKELINTPFENGLDETVAYLSWLDMFLDAYRLIRQNEEDGQEDEANVQTPEQLRKELKLGAQYLYNRQTASRGRAVSIHDGIGISHVAARFGLRGYPFFCLLLAVAPEFDEHYVQAYRLLREDGMKHGSATFALAEILYGLIADEDEMLEARRSINLICGCPLFQVYECEDNASGLLDRFSANRQLVSLLKGDYELDGSMRRICSEVYEASQELPPVLVAKEQFARIRGMLRTRVDAGERQLIHITGAKGSGRRFLTAHGADQIVLYVELEPLLHRGAEEAAQVMKQVLVRAACMGSLLVLAGGTTETGQLDLLKTMLETCFAVLSRVVLTTETTENIDELAGAYEYFHVEIPACKTSDRRLIWDYYLGECPLDEEVRIDSYAAKYRFTPGVIRRCITQAVMIAESHGHSELTDGDLREAIRHFNSSKLAELAVRIEPHFGWDDIEIADEQRSIMRLVCARAALGGIVDEEWGFEKKVSYGKGVSILLYGPPGTGKTMAAQIMAGEIGMDLYRVDLSQLVDKYIGETQKNIGKIFDCAREGNFILFFDEADSMFSKRTDIQNSNDKHANTETAYLLQKIEEYDGITFLATNRYDNFDSAFLRRITYSVKLDRPDAATRLRLFQSILPASARVDEELDFPFFAEHFELTGSNIKAILYNAAFMAAAENRGICNEHIVRAIKYECTKLGKMVMAAEMGMYAVYL